MCCAQAGQTVYHIVAATYNAKDIAEELLHLDCPLDTPDEDVRSCIIAREIATHTCTCSFQGNTALHVAYWRGNQAVAAALLDCSKKRGLKLEAVKNTKVHTKSIIVS